MSWDVIIMRMPENIRTTADLQALTEPIPDIPLGTVAQVREHVVAVFPETEWTEHPLGIWNGTPGSIEFRLGTGRDDHATSMLMLSIRADDSIVPTVVALAARLGATAVETGSGGLLTDASGIRRWREMREQELG